MQKSRGFLHKYSLSGLYPALFSFSRIDGYFEIRDIFSIKRGLFVTKSKTRKTCLQRSFQINHTRSAKANGLSSALAYSRFGGNERAIRVWESFKSYFVEEGEAIKNVCLRQCLTQEELGEKMEGRFRICKPERRDCSDTLPTTGRVFRVSDIATATLDLGTGGRGVRAESRTSDKK